MRPFILNLIVLLCMNWAYCQVPTPATQLSQAPWETQKPAPGLTWKSCLFQDLYGAPQSLNVLIWEPDKSALRLRIAYRDSSKATVTAFADSAKAVAAINGGFFSKAGRAVSYLRVKDSVVAPSEKGVVSFVEEAAFAVNEENEFHLALRPARGWQSADPGFAEALATGPLLLLDGQLVAQKATSFNLNRHPRSGMGLRADGSVIFITADGRAEAAAGMSTLEFARLFQVLGCQQALNLDGGGSTTLWVRGHGVVNYPSDNKAFDHQGERAVANAWLLVE